jgi:hypothetical protein
MVTLNWGWKLSRLDYGETQVYIYGIPKNGSLQKRLAEALRAALNFAEEHLCPYPYPVLSVVDLPASALEGGSVSAPMLAAISNIAFDPLGQRFVPERAAIRQVGEQFFKWLIAYEDPAEQRLCDGLSEWFADGVMCDAYPNLMRFRRFTSDNALGPWQAGRVFSVFPSCFSKAIPDVMRSGKAQKGTEKLAYWPFPQLATLLGEDAMQGAIRSFLAEHSYRSSGRGDFLRSAESHSKRDLAAFWKHHAEGKGTLRYEIKSVGRTSDGRGAVTLGRAGNLVAPVAIWVRFEDGREETRELEIEGELATLYFDGPITGIVLDPEMKHPEMKGGLHTTWTAAPKRRGLLYWAQNVLGAMGGLLQGIGFG